MTDEPLIARPADSSTAPNTEWCDLRRGPLVWPHDHQADNSGLDDGPWLPGCAPRKQPPPKTPEEVREIKMKAVATRRERYGPRGRR